MKSGLTDDISKSFSDFSKMTKSPPTTATAAATVKKKRKKFQPNKGISKEEYFSRLYK